MDLSDPLHDGPTTAERFVDDICAIRALKAHDLPIPPQLEMGAILARYAVGSTVEKSAANEANKVSFMDGSVTKKNRRGRWNVWR